MGDDRFTPFGEIASAEGSNAPNLVWGAFPPADQQGFRVNLADQVHCLNVVDSSKLTCPRVPSWTRDGQAI